MRKVIAMWACLSCVCTRACACVRVPACVHEMSGYYVSVFSGPSFHAFGRLYQGDCNYKYINALNRHAPCLCPSNIYYLPPLLTLCATQPYPSPLTSSVLLTPASSLTLPPVFPACVHAHTNSHGNDLHHHPHHCRQLARLIQ